MAPSDIFDSLLCQFQLSLIWRIFPQRLNNSNQWIYNYVIYSPCPALSPKETSIEGKNKTNTLRVFCAFYKINVFFGLQSISSRI